MSDTDEIRKLRKLCSDLRRVHQGNEERYGKAAEMIERLMAEHDDYVIRANANVCELNREIERLRAHIDTLIQERDVERQTYNDAIARHLSEIEQLRARVADLEERGYSLTIGRNTR